MEKPYICDTLFCYERTWGNFIGVLCRPEEFVVCNQYAKLKDTTYSLPCFSFQSSDIYNWDDKNLRFMRRIRLGEPEKYIPVGNVDELIRTTISDRMSWKLYKDCIGKIKLNGGIVKHFLTERVWSLCMKKFQKNLVVPWKLPVKTLNNS